MIAIYHSRDLDGIACGAIIKAKYPKAHLIGYHYGEPLELPKELKGTPIIMADVSVPFEKMMEISEFSNHQFTWIDHHRSVILEFHKFMKKNPVKFEYVLVDGIAACEATYRHLNKVAGVPTGIRMLSQYDVWDQSDKWKWENEILPFQYGMRGICNKPDNFPAWIFDKVDKYMVEDTIQSGLTIMDYEDIQNEKQCSLFSFEAEWEGMRVIAMNGGGFNSKVFESVYNPKKHHLMMPFAFDGRQWTVSMYTTREDIDCSEIAKTRGGGGHKKAAGFQVKDFNEINFKNIRR